MPCFNIQNICTLQSSSRSTQAIWLSLATHTSIYTLGELHDNNNLLASSSNMPRALLPYVYILFFIIIEASPQRSSGVQCVFLDHVSHPLYDTLAQQRSSFSRRLLSPRCTAEIHRKSFLPVVINLYNARPLKRVRHPPSLEF